MRFTPYWPLAVLCVLAACGNPQPTMNNVKIGKPYVVDGVSYYPAYDEVYDKTGQASWYGPGFHGKYTANGEVFDQADLTAAHPTLPMPSLVRVTNLANGKSAIIRVNDRGPFKSNRIIDLSKASATRLGIRSLAPVRVQFLKKETEEYIASLQTGHPVSMADINDRPSPQIVEETVASSATGNPITEAAPVLSVSSNDTMPSAPQVQPQPQVIETVEQAQAPVVVETEPPPQPIVQSNLKTQPVTLSTDNGWNANHTPPLAKAAAAPQQKWADDNVSLPEPGKTAAYSNYKAKPAQTLQAPPANAAPASGGKYTIQAGSFASKDNAQKLSSKLSSVAQGSVEPIEVSGKTWFRVRVGSYYDRETAQADLDQVRLSVPDARIVQP